jgi:hypothetical protein
VCFRFLTLSGFDPVPERAEITGTDDVDDLARVAAGDPFGAALDVLDFPALPEVAEQAGKTGVTGHDWLRLRVARPGRR